MCGGFSTRVQGPPPILSPIPSVTYSGDGSTTAWAVPFSFVDRSDVVVLLNGNPTTAFGWTSNGVIQFSTAPALGTVIVITRQTAADDASVQFTGGIPTPALLTAAFKKVLYIAQEAYAAQTLNLAGASAAGAAAGAQQAAAAIGVSGIIGLGATVNLPPGTNVTIPANSLTTVPWTAVSASRGPDGNFVTSAPTQLTVHRPGRYRLSTCLRWDATLAGWRQALLAKNGSGVAGLPQDVRAPAGPGAVVPMASAPIYCVPGDYFQVLAYTTVAASILGDPSTWFSLERVSD